MDKNHGWTRIFFVMLAFEIPKTAGLILMSLV